MCSDRYVSKLLRSSFNLLSTYPETVFKTKAREKEERESNAITARNMGISQGTARTQKEKEKEAKEKVITVFMVSNTPQNNGQHQLLVKDSI